MAQEINAFIRFALSKTGFAPTTSDVSWTQDSSDPAGHYQTQDLTADTIEALSLGDVALPCKKIVSKMIIPTSGGSIEFSLKNSTDFDAYRFAVLEKQNDCVVWAPKLGTTIYVKSIGAAGRIATLAG